MKRQQTFFQTVCALAIPVALQSMLQSSFGMVDQIMIGQLGAVSVAAVGLADDAAKYPAEISGGMQKRAGLARAIVRRSDIVLYDEPTSGLDPVTSVTINRLIRRLNRKRGITSVVVTHDLQGALLFADRILMLKGGHVVELAPAEAFVRSTKPDVRDFLDAQFITADSFQQMKAAYEKEF